MGDKTRGLYEKFDVTRTDGKSEPGQKHYMCDYFVLDKIHDPFAVAAMIAYAQVCEAEYPLLAQDIMRDVGQMIERFPEMAGHYPKPVLDKDKVNE